MAALNNKLTANTIVLWSDSGDVNKIPTSDSSTALADIDGYGDNSSSSHDEDDLKMPAKDDDDDISQQQW